LNGRVREARTHDVIIVPAGNLHNVINAGKNELKLIVIYSLPLYPDGAAYKTREEATDVTAKALERAWEQ
jgi:oxalate decarboxylase/phosphoglucose isomerase-like protein (cupin superfamily)